MKLQPQTSGHNSSTVAIIITRPLPQGTHSPTAGHSLSAANAGPHRHLAPADPVQPREHRKIEESEPMTKCQQFRAIIFKITLRAELYKLKDGIRNYEVICPWYGNQPQVHLCLTAWKKWSGFRLVELRSQLESQNTGIKAREGIHCISGPWGQN